MCVERERENGRYIYILYIICIYIRSLLDWQAGVRAEIRVRERERVKERIG